MALDNRSSKKQVERKRYDAMASIRLSQLNKERILGAQGIEELLREPYIEYERVLAELLGPNLKVLEIGSGFGMHTNVLVNSGAKVCALDISPKSIELLKYYFSNYKNLYAHVGDIEALPFNDNEFDIVCCAGSLSYGDSGIVFSEIYRVLKKDGYFICVDSLGNNVIYNINRYIQYLRGYRTADTIQNMPTVSSIDRLSLLFDAHIKYYGSILWLLKPLNIIVKQKYLAKLSSQFDKILKIKKSAFKFICVARK